MCGCSGPRASFSTSWPAESDSIKPASAILVIGYGNTLRRDDGVGPRVAETIATLNLPGVTTLACPLLTPELADPVAKAERVVFVDAAIDTPREVQFRKLEPAESSQIMAHAADPRTLLALARDVFGRVPEAWWLTIPVDDLAIGDTFSPRAQAGFQEAVNRIKQMAKPEPGRPDRSNARKPGARS
jgi:hydrogenase maturation protease